MLSWLTIVVASADLAPAAAFKRQSISPLSPDQISNYAAFTHFAPRCSAMPFWFCHGAAEVICPFVHQDVPLLTALQLPSSSALRGKTPLSIDSGVDGTEIQYCTTTPMVLSAVQDVTSKYNATSVPTVGHSLGAAPSLLDSVHLQLQLPADISVKVILYGLPRVGNQDWANFVDTHPRFIGYYHHPSGEIHIDDADAWDVCPAQDNPSKMCVVGAVPSLFHSNWWDHDGPYYDGIVFSCTTPLLTADS
ncbi:lipase [Lactarius pseudohatsudake]|nr:lipase [Lactarius pseudohatsudake]